VPVIVLRTRVAAPASLCFDLARDVELHQRSTAASRERAVGGITSGLLGPGDEVTWEATHFGVRQRLTSRITEFEPPRRFVDEMVRGAFATSTSSWQWKVEPRCSTPLITHRPWGHWAGWRISSFFVST